ncbi:MAG: type V CRISPR-associated protein Cas4 [Anaerovoracaceae bacterium]|jgi:CRISPR-associated exonuclease Cas4
MADRIGRQTPTESFVLPYQKTDGAEAIESYEKSGRTAMDWQKLLVYDMLAKEDDNQWTHMKYGIAVPRQNGKNEAVAIREMYGLLHGEKILHTAHRTDTSHTAWERLLEILSDAGLVKPDKKDKGLYRAFGKEHQTVDSNNYSTSKNIITSLDAYSDQYNLICKVDMYYKDKQRIVERKKKIKRIYDGYVFQLYAQYFCLTEMGYPVTSLQLYSMDDNKKYDVKLPEDDLPMYEKFTGTIQAILHFNLEEFVQTNVEKCRHCIYEPACDRADIKEKE